MSLYSRDDERAIRVQRLVNDWTKSGLLIPEQRDRILPELQVDLRRTNIFLRVTLFVFGYMIVNALTGLFVVTLNLSEDATMFLALAAAAAFFVAAHVLVKQFRLYHFGIEEAAAVASVSFGAIGLSMLLHSNFSILAGADRGRRRLLPDLPAVRAGLRRRRGDDLRRLDSVRHRAGGHRPAAGRHGDHGGGVLHRARAAAGSRLGLSRRRVRGDRGGVVGDAVCVGQPQDLVLAGVAGRGARSSTGRPTPRSGSCRRSASTSRSAIGTACCWM